METTWEQQMAVRRDECRVNGHSFSEVVVFGCLAPISVICERCGSLWTIRDEDRDQDFNPPAGAQLVDSASSPDPVSLPLAEKAE